MKTKILWAITLLSSFELAGQVHEDNQKNNSQINPTDMRQIFIDKFTVPAHAQEEFMERMAMNRSFIKELPGFIEDNVYEHRNEDGTLMCVTVAVWENETALEKAKAAVQEEYKKQGFDPAAMLKRLGITMDRDTYTAIDANKDIKTSEKNKATARKLYEDCLNRRNFKLLTELLHEDYVGVSGEKGPSGFTNVIQPLITAFPDIQWTIEDLVAEGDKVVVRSSWEGTHTETFNGFIPPTQQQVTNHAITIYQFRDHKIVKAWIETDRLGFLQQTGHLPQDLIPPPPQIKE